MQKRLLAALLFSVVVLVNLQGCAHVTFASGANASKSTVDRRSEEVKAEDEAIEWKSCSRIAEKLGQTAHVNCKSFNHKVLVTGEVPTLDAKNEVQSIVSSVSKVKKVSNFLTIGPVSDINDRKKDILITTGINVRGKDSGKLNPVHVQVVTEARVVYSMGMVSQAEANSASDVIRTTAGAKSYIYALEIITPEQAKALDDAHAGNIAP